MKSLRTKLLLTVAIIILGCGVSLSAIMTYWYSRDLYQLARTEAERLAHQLALESTEKVLLNKLEVKGTIAVNLALTPASLKIAPGSKEKVTITYLTKLRNQ